MDKLDRQILMILQQDARTKYSDIAKQLKKPTSTIFERVKRLEENGTIQKYVAILDPERVGYNVTAFLMGQAELGKNVDLDKIGEKLSKIPQITEVHFITGDYDYLIKLRVKDQKEYYKVISDIARTFISRGKGMIVPKTFKEKITFDL